MLKLFEGDIEDVATERSFRELLKFVNAQIFLKGTYRHMEIEVPGARTNYKVEHKLGFTPNDAIITWQTGAGALTVNYASFDSTYMDFTTTGAVTFRIIVGKYSEN